jgi:hypothetical protein
MIRIGNREFSLLDIREQLNGKRAILVESLANCHEEYRRLELETSLRMTDATLLALYQTEAQQQGNLAAGSSSIN